MRVTHRTNLAFAVLAVAAMCSAAVFPARAQQCEPTFQSSADGYLERITQQINQGCFGEANDTSAVAAQVRPIIQLAGDKASLYDWREVRRTLTVAADHIAREVLLREASANQNWRPIWESVRQELGNVSSSLGTVTSIPEPMHWARISTAYFQRPDGVFAIDFGTRIAEDCEAPGADSIIPAECLNTLEESATLIRLTRLTQDVLEVAAARRLQAGFAGLTAIDAEWDYYFDRTRSQYLWELRWNQRRFSRYLRQQPEDQREQLVGPPGDQVIFMHPSISLEYVGGGAENATAYEAVATVEVIGYNRFRWGDNTRRPPLGASLVVTATNDNTGERSGYGVIVHINNNWSIGATRRDTGSGDETTWLVSADLLKKVLEKSTETRERFRRGD